MSARDATAGDGPRSRLHLVQDAGVPAPARSAELSRSAEPRSSDRSRSRASHPALGLRRRPLLYVGGQADERILFSRIARRWQALKVLVAPTGRAGLRIATERRLGVVVVHAALPDTDAVDFVSAVRARAVSPSVPVVVIGDEGSSAERARFLWAGAGAYVATPLRIAEVDQALSMLLEAAAIR